jgi:hypothetical protein
MLISTAAKHHLHYQHYRCPRTSPTIISVHGTTYTATINQFPRAKGHFHCINSLSIAHKYVSTTVYKYVHMDIYMRMCKFVIIYFHILYVDIFITGRPTGGPTGGLPGEPQ